jgi:hypothetical protein
VDQLSNTIAQVNNMQSESETKTSITSIQVDFCRIFQNQTLFPPPTYFFPLFLSIPLFPPKIIPSHNPQLQTIETPLSLNILTKQTNTNTKMYPCHRCHRNIGMRACPFCGYAHTQPFSQVYNPSQNPWSQPYVMPLRMHSPPSSVVNERTSSWIDTLETGYDEFGDPLERGRVYKGHSGKGCHYPPMD